MVNTLPLPERATEVLQNSSCVATLVEHGVFILFFSLSIFFTFFLSLLEELQQVLQTKKQKKKSGVCVSEVTGVRESDQWRSISRVHVRASVCS